MHDLVIFNYLRESSEALDNIFLGAKIFSDVQIQKRKLLAVEHCE